MNHTESVSGPKDSHRLITGIALALIAGLAYSSEAIAAKLLYAQGLPPLAVLTWRFLLATLMFALWARPHYKSHHLHHAQLYTLFLLGLSQGATVLFLFYAFMYIPAGLAIFLFYLYPTLVTVLEVLFLGIHPTKKRVLALILTLVGLVIIAGPALSSVSWPGLLCAVAAAFGNAIFLILSDRSLDKLPVPIVSTGTTASATAALFIIALVTQTPLTFSVTPINIGLMLFLVLVPSVLALGCLLAAISRLGPGRAAIVATAEPFFTTLLGFFILKEHLFIRELIGGILIVLAVLLESR
ncbi:MAG: DMT family transporter [bacterium]